MSSVTYDTKNSDPVVVYKNGGSDLIVNLRRHNSL